MPTRTGDRASNEVLELRLNSVSPDEDTVSSSDGLTVITRDSSTTVQAYRGTTKVLDESNSSTGLPTGSILFLGYNNQGNKNGKFPNRLRMAWIGSTGALKFTWKFKLDNI